MSASNPKRRTPRPCYDFSRRNARSTTSQIERVAINHEFVNHIGDQNLEYVHFDLLDVAVSAYIVDRLEKRYEHKARSLKLVVPVRKIEMWTNPKVKLALEQTLGFLTEDHWSFEFVQAKVERPPHAASPLFAAHTGKFAVDLFSGGLDSAAGTLRAAFGRAPNTRTLLVSGVTSYNNEAQQTQTIDAMNEIVRAATGVKDHFVHLPFYFNLKRDQLDDWFINEKRQEKSQRSRGFIFPVLGLVVAATLGLRELQVFENGIGAINLPPISANIGIDQSRSMHPLHLANLEDFFALLLPSPIKILNVNAYRTKGEMCQDIDRSHTVQLLSTTVSCDSYGMRLAIGSPKQCGRCSSCLLRRVSSSAAGVIESRDSYLKLTTLEEAKVVDHTTEPLALMNFQAQKLEAALTEGTMEAFVSAFPDIELARSGLQQLEPHLPSSEIELRLIRLYKRYLREWQSFYLELTCTPIAA
jgi:7-cyano-7-deazaguanine synthase in queuosine biosynthesis